MRTTAFAPPYPVDLATWLASFRHRITNERGNPISPEQLGKAINISGATVRRWETGRLRPDPQAAARLAQACHLTTYQSAFLERALRINQDIPPSPEEFIQKATPVLNSPFPVYIMDNLLYIRAWNSHVPNFLDRRWDAITEDYHYIEFVLQTALSDDLRPTLRERLRHAVLDLWFFTAHACGTTEYRAMIDRLSVHEAFREEWSRLAFLQDEDFRQIGLPYYASRAGVGEMMICPFMALFPPIYEVRQYMPIDELAHANLRRLQEQGPPEIYFSRRPHWKTPEPCSDYAEGDDRQPSKL